MQFQVPQFIEVEDKIFGPLTFKQFVYVTGSVAGAFILTRLLPALIAYPLGAALIGFGLALAFFRINNRPFIFVVEAFMKYITTPRLYIWKKTTAVKTENVKKEENIADQMLAQMNSNAISDTKLQEIAWALDTKKQ